MDTHCQICEYRYRNRAMEPCLNCKDYNFCYPSSDEDLFEIMFKEDGIIKKHQPSYKQRPDQQVAAKKLMDALITNNHFIFEGPTGFGKTYAYGIPLMQYLHTNPSLTAVIVTDGISLQEQLYHNDIPKISEFFQSVHDKFEMKFSLLKGRQNYLCALKMATKFKPENILEHKEIMNMYHNNGQFDLSYLSFVPEYSLLSNIVCTKASDCKGKQRCKYAENCGYMKAKLQAASSRIIITNYHLLFSDIETGGMVLPPHDIIIFDEAHEMPNIFRDFKEKKFSILELMKLKDNLREANEEYDMIHYSDGDVTKLSLEKRLTDIVELSVLYFQDIFEKMNPNDYEETKILNVEFKINKVDTFEQVFKSYVQEFDSFTRAICRDGEDCGEELYRDYGKLLETIFKSLNTMCALLVEVSTKECCDATDKVYYVEKSSIDKGIICKPEARISIHKKNLDMSRFIKAEFIDKYQCVFTSATLTTSKKVRGVRVTSFDYIKKCNGLCYTDKIIEYAGKSPFNLSDQQLWFIHPSIKNPKDDDFEKTLSSNIKDIIDAANGGVLCLFTSIKNMNNTHKSLKNAFRDIKVMKQGEAPRMKLLEEFKQNSNSVLFGTKSFFTGIDIPGESLRCVIIDKIPFPNLSDPVIKKMNESSKLFFRDHYTPLAVISLKQAVGRGVRTETDKCVICVLDFRFFSASGSNYSEDLQYAFNYTKKVGKDPYDITMFLAEKETNEDLDCF